MKGGGARRELKVRRRGRVAGEVEVQGESWRCEGEVEFSGGGSKF